MSDIVEDLIFMHNDSLARGEDHDKVLARVDALMTAHLPRFNAALGAPSTVASEQERIAIEFEQGLNTELSRKMLRVIRGQDNQH